VRSIYDRAGMTVAASRTPSEIGAGVLIVAGGDAAPLLEPAEASLDGVALFVEFGVELGRPSAARPSCSGFRSGRSLRGWCGGCGACQLGAGGGVGVGLVRQQVRRPVAGLGQGVQQQGQVRVVTSLPGGQQQRPARIPASARAWILVVSLPSTGRSRDQAGRNTRSAL
jgi:hypothetical protein